MQRFRPFRFSSALAAGILALPLVAQAQGVSCFVSRANDYICTDAESAAKMSGAFDGAGAGQSAPAAAVPEPSTPPGPLPEVAAPAPELPPEPPQKPEIAPTALSEPAPAEPEPVFPNAVEQQEREPAAAEPAPPAEPEPQPVEVAAPSPPPPPPADGPSCSGESLLSMDFSDGKTTPPNLKWSDKGDNARVENGALAVTYDKGVTGTKGGSQWKGDIGAHNEAFASYKVCFPEDWDGVKGGKLPGLCGGTCPTGGADASDGFSTRYMWRPGGKLVLYFYHHNMPGKFGENLEVGQMKPGECVELAQRVRLNDVGKDNGEITVWVNGEQSFSAQNMELRTSDWQIDTFYFSTFFGGSGPEWAPNKEESLTFDDIAVCAPGDAPITVASGTQPLG